jgi:hypothetical protein
MEKFMHLRLIIGSVLAICLSFAGGVASAATNLVPNGNFEGGNTLFTSDYAFSPASNTTEGEYTVRSNPFPWNGAFVSIGDHTSGAGLMMVANGSPISGDVVWRSQSIAVGAATNYFFEAFVNNVCCQGFSFGPGSESILEFSLSLNGNAPISLGTITTNLALAGTWEWLSTQFLSPSAGNVVLSLINRNTNRGGNDFAIDDVFFGTQSTVNTVPEPETYAMLLAGLGLLGFAARRRKQKAA